MIKNLTTKSDLIKVSIGANIGTTIEWYDFFIYGYAAIIVFPGLFFRFLDPYLAYLLSLITFTLGFIGRPLGSLLFGYVGDKLGRKFSLSYDLLFMGIGTLAIGLLPGYEVLGITAPILLTIFRFFQGIGLGGEWGNAVTWVGEHAFKGYRGFWVSWVQQGVPLGLIAAAGITGLLISLGIYETIGWRISFIIGGVTALVGIIIRILLLESPLFKRYLEKGQILKNPVAHAFRKNWKDLLLGVVIWGPNGATFFIYSTYSISYLGLLGISREISFTTLTISAIFMSLFIALFAVLSDQIGRRKLLILTLMIGIPVTITYPLLFIIKNFWTILFGQVLLAAVFSAYYAAMAPYLVEIFDTKIRATATGFICGTGSVIGGGFAPVIATIILAGDPLRWWTIPTTLSLYYIPALITLIIRFKESFYKLELS
jgi:MFS family permease